MFLPAIQIEQDSLISDIVKQDYRTASVFEKYELDYCCGGAWQLGRACETGGIAFDQLKAELLEVSQRIGVPPSLPFESWPIEFLIGYIIHIHHDPLRLTLTDTGKLLSAFVRGHSKKYPYLLELHNVYEQLKNNIGPHMKEEEENLFPYIRRISTAFRNRDSYARLLVKTLRQPIEMTMAQDDSLICDFIEQARRLTDNYTPPDGACTRHQVALRLLKELDQDLVQHFYLENKILFPRAVQIERELLT